MQLQGTKSIWMVGLFTVMVWFVAMGGLVYQLTATGIMDLP